MIRELKNNKAVGDDEIPVEVLKCLDKRRSNRGINRDMPRDLCSVFCLEKKVPEPIFIKVPERIFMYD